MKTKIKSNLVQYSLFDQVEEPPAVEITGLSGKEQAMRDKICKEWRICPYGETCMDDTINLDCVCYKDEPDKYPGTGAEKSFDFTEEPECVACHAATRCGCCCENCKEKCNLSQRCTLGAAATLPELVKLGFSRCQAKILTSGFHLVRYTREHKRVEFTRADPRSGWKVMEAFPTFAAAERAVAELKEAGSIPTGQHGKIIMSGWNQPGGLLKAGFEFYRCYGLNQYDQGCCIKQGSKNWSNWGKYESPVELKKAWDDIMINDLKALEG